MRYLPGKQNAAADFLSRLPGVRTNSDEIDNSQDDDDAATVAAATVAALDLSGCVTLDEAAVLQAAMNDSDYQFLVSKVTNGDWCPRRSQKQSVCNPSTV